MRPSPTPSAFFAADQDWLFRVRSWDTPQTVLENDVASQGMQLRVYQPKDENTDWTAYATALKNVSKADGSAGSNTGSANPETAFVDATYATAAVEDGRWPLVQSYWGGGAPNWWGGARTARVALAYTGTLVSAARRSWLTTGRQFTFALAGSGWARIDVIEGATRTTLFRGDLSETMFLTKGFSYSDTRTLAEGATLVIYYVQTPNDPWGGLVVKAIAGSRPSDANTFGPVARAAAAAAPVVSGGLFSYGDGLEATTLPFILSASVTQEPGGAPKAEIEVPLVNPAVNDGSGWVFYQQDPATDPGALRVYEGGQLVYTLKRKRLVQIQVARRAESPVWSPIFTGHVDDFGSGSNGRLTIQAVGFEGRLVEQYEQAPDRVSYMARGYKVLDYQAADVADRVEPVYNVPAFDNWPLDWAVQELGTRAGIDPSCYAKAWEVVRSDGTGQVATMPWGTAKRFRATSLTGDAVRLPRPVHYGNVGLSFTEDRPFDDAYMFKIEPTKDLWARTRELTDRLGYTCRFDATGAAVLYPTLSPAYVKDLVPADAVTGTPTQVINPAAYGAKYLRVAGGSAATVRATVTGSRIDVSFPRAANLRPWTVRVSASGTQVAEVTVTPTSTNTTPECFFNSVVSAQGANPTVATIYSGEYREYVVTLVADSGATDALVDCVIVYAQDPDKTILPALSTSDAADAVTTRSVHDAVRNKVTIVGRRKAAVTDSDKFAEAQAPTEQEFVVHNAVDVHSITDPAATNYVGYLKQSVIYDDTVADDGLAKYLAAVFIYRQAMPRVGTSVSHTLLPMLEVGDPIAVAETKYDTASSSMTQYVTRVTHTINTNRFQTKVETDAWPNYPAYQPRTDINLADFDNKPVADLTVSYVSLSGHSFANPSINNVKQVDVFGTMVESAATTSGGALSIPSGLPWPPVPGSFQLQPRPANSTNRYAINVRQIDLNGKWTAGQQVAVFPLTEDEFVQYVKVKVASTLTQVSVNSYELVYDVPSGVDSKTGYFYYERRPSFIAIYRGTKALDFLATQIAFGKVEIGVKASNADSRTSWLTNNPYHQFVTVNYQDNPTTKVAMPWLQTPNLTLDSALTVFNIRYRSLYPSTARTDPNGVDANNQSKSPFYDPYTSELGNLVSFSCSVLAEGRYRISIRNWDDDTPVAWLTNPTADPLKEEMHWEYLPIMANKQFTWDGVDQIGLWNSLQSELYSELVEGSFEDGKKPRVGRGFYCWNRELGASDLGPLAYVWMKRDSTTGLPVIGQGTYAAWYVHVEAQTSVAGADTEVRSKDDDIAVLTHLPEPTKLEIKLEDYNPATSQWETLSPTGSSSAITAYINNLKPVRMRFKVAPRPGALWASKESELSVKLTREVHLRAVIGDQVIVYAGKAFAGTSVEDRTVYNRRLVNDEHTKQYVDSGYRKAKTLKWTDGDTADAVTEWTFQPSDFKKDFRIQGLDEPLEFGNYLQLEEVPAWNGARDVTSARSRLQFALMSYLFYLSAYVTDRSGRSSWGINRSFVDKSKIYNNTTPLDWPLDSMYEQRRTVFCRQWTGETDWAALQLNTYGNNASSLHAKLLQSFWYQHDPLSASIGAATPATWASFNLPTDNYTIAMTPQSSGSDTNRRGGKDFLLPYTYYTMASRQLGSLTTSALGTWTWESFPTWVPSITRDLHPFFLLPPMVSPPTQPGDNPYVGFERDLAPINCFSVIGGFPTKVTVRGSRPYNNIAETTSRDAGGSTVWNSPVLDFTSSGNAIRFYPGSVVDIKQEPTKDNIQGNHLNYVRQNEMVHWEQLRGIYSRGRYPMAQAAKVAPAGHYYLNPHRYLYGLEITDTLSESPYPIAHVIVSRSNPGQSVEWFRVAFRSEYVWESGSMFPTTREGVERLEGVLWWRHRFVPRANSLYYDFGAWTGWKDDLQGGSPQVIGGRRVSGNYTSSDIAVGNPFTTGAMPIAVGPVLPQTVELLCHLVLVPERRGS